MGVILSQAANDRFVAFISMRPVTGRGRQLPDADAAYICYQVVYAESFCNFGQFTEGARRQRVIAKSLCGPGQ